MGSLEDHKGFGSLHPQFWGLEPPLVEVVLDDIPSQPTTGTFRVQFSAISRVLVHFGSEVQKSEYEKK